MSFIGEPPVTIQCAVCGKPRTMPFAWFKKVKSPTCSRACNGKRRVLAARPHQHTAWNKRGEAGKQALRLAMTGESNPAWKGGVTYRKRHGNYVSVKYVRCPTEFIGMARKDGYVMEHRLVMARWVGRTLERVEVVHHADHAPLNNGQSNLELWPDNRSHKIAEHGRVPTGAANRWQ